MKHMDTEMQIIERLRTAGYPADIRLDRDGRLKTGTVEFDPEEAVVHEVERVEGMSNPDDASIIVAVSGPNGVKGTLVLPYGPDVSGPQADAMRSLTSSRGV